MSEITDLANRIETVIERAKPAIESTRWTSSRLWATAAAVLVLVWMCRGTIQACLWPVTVIVCVFLITRSWTDSKTIEVNGRLAEKRNAPAPTPQ